MTLLFLKVFVFGSTLSGANCGQFGILALFQVLIADSFSILALIQVLIAENFGILALFQALIKDSFSILAHLGKINTVQGMNP